MGGFAWVTLATNDSYSLGALVLAHSLKQSGTCHQLAVLVTPGVTNAMREKLSSVFNVVQEVNILDSKDETNLRLLKRPELGITFTKLHCWRLTQFKKCVFLDADTLVLKNSDELFERDEFSAAPDVGWPDCFNSGVYVYCPSNETYEKLVQFALDKGSFDGGDQGLLNLYFADWARKDINKHLPFIYNMCSTACYSYLPAFKQFGSEVKIVHFISSTKPWLQYFDTETKQVQPAGDMQHLKTVLQCWWDIFCSLIHPNLSSDMNRSTTSNEHKVPLESPKNLQPQTPVQNYSQSPDYQNCWDPWEDYDIQNFPPPSEPPPRHEQENIDNSCHFYQPPSLETFNSEQENPQSDQYHVVDHEHSHIQSANQYQDPNPIYFEPPSIPHYVTAQPPTSNYNPSPPPTPQYQTLPTPPCDPPETHHHKELSQLEQAPQNEKGPYEQSSPTEPQYEYPQSLSPHCKNPPPTTQSEPPETPHSHNIQRSPHYQHFDKSPSQQTLLEQETHSSLSCTIVPKNVNKSPDHELRIDFSSSLVDTTLHSNDQADCNGGLAGAFAQFSLGSPRSPNQIALEDHLRRQGWEVGNIDYMGRDSFDNIWSKICETLAAGTQQEKPTESPKVEEPQEVEKLPKVEKPAEVQEKICETSTKVESEKVEETKGVDVKPTDQEKDAPKTPEKIEELLKPVIEGSMPTEETPKVLEETPKIAEDSKSEVIVKPTVETSKPNETKPAEEVAKPDEKVIKPIEEVPKPVEAITTDIAKSTEEKCTNEPKTSEEVQPVEIKKASEDKAKPTEETVVEVIKAAQECLKPIVETKPIDETKALDVKPQEKTILDVECKLEAECIKKDSKLEEKVDLAKPIECPKLESEMEEKTKTLTAEAKADSNVEEAKIEKSKPEAQVGEIKLEIKEEEIAEIDAKESKIEAKLNEDTVGSKADTKSKEDKPEVKPEEVTCEVKLEEAKGEVKPKETKTEETIKEVKAEVKSEEVIHEEKPLEAKMETKVEVVKTEEKPEQSKTEVIPEVKTEETPVQSKTEVIPEKLDTLTKSQIKAEPKPEEIKAEIRPEEIKLTTEGPKVEERPAEAKVEEKPEVRVEVKPEEVKSVNVKGEVKPEELKSEAKSEQSVIPASETKQEPITAENKKGKGKKDKKKPPVECPKPDCSKPEPPTENLKSDCPKAECPKEKCAKSDCPKEKCPKAECLKEKCEKKDCPKKSKSKTPTETKQEVPKTPEVIEATPPTSPPITEKPEEKALGVETAVPATPPPQSASTETPTPPPRKSCGGKKAKAKK